MIASNNFGSGIFSHLPIANWPQFETYMAAAHSWRFEEAAKMFDISYLPFENISFEKPALIELFTNRKDNYQFQKEFLETCQTRLKLDQNEIQTGCT